MMMKPSKKQRLGDSKRRGYLPPKPMASMLQAFIDDSTPGSSLAADSVVPPSLSEALSLAQRTEMGRFFVEAYDRERSDWGDTHPYSIGARSSTVSAKARRAMRRWRRWRGQTLTSGLKLLDPIWGGVNQFKSREG